MYRLRLLRRETRTRLLIRPCDDLVEWKRMRPGRWDCYATIRKCKPKTTFFSLCTHAARLRRDNTLASCLPLVTSESDASMARA